MKRQEFSSNTFSLIGGVLMNVEGGLQKIKFAELSRVYEKLLNKILLERRLQRGFDRELDLEELDSVAAAKKIRIMEGRLNE